MSLADLRREYSLSGLRKSNLDPDPLLQFKRWFADAVGVKKSSRLRKLLIRCYKRLLLVTGAESLDMNAMTLATVDKHGHPSARIVLLKGLDERGFIFYTNYESRKGKELAENPNASLVFYWPEQERQVCVAGKVRRLPASESEAYFQSRPLGSQIAAWASRQSEKTPDRDELEKAWKARQQEFQGKNPLPLPPFWGGYVLEPDRLEFWQGRPNRLHDRFLYTRVAQADWTIDRLFP